ncbi:MAG: ATP-binding protein [Alphaproteobacteria bacterium]
MTPPSPPLPSPAALLDVLERIAEALERLAPKPPPPCDLLAADAFVWQAAQKLLDPVATVSHVDIALLRGIDHQSALLLENTRHFARGLPANNALLWGARGTGKSSLVKAVHAAVNAEAREHGTHPPLALVEIHREDIPTLSRLLAILAGSGRRSLLFCDDLSFSAADEGYKSLKAVLEGGLRGRPDTVLVYATSNRRHMMPRDMMENEGATAITPGEAVEEKVSLSDRFGLWLGFHAIDQETFMAIVAGYAQAFGLDLPPERLRAEANEWSVTRGARSGRVAWQFIQDLRGRLEPPVTP